jgi:diacylglycerol kinase family enzyme
MAEKILWTINPQAGNGNAEPLIERIKFLSHQQKIYQTTGFDDLNKVTNLIRDFGPDRIVSGGGDGTFQMVARALMQAASKIPVAILPIGSANGMATELGIPTTMDEYLDYAISSKDFIHTDAIKIGDNYCLHMADAGLNAAMVKGYEQQSVRGFTGYTLGFLDAAIASDLTFEVEISENQKWPTLQVILANTKKYGTGVEINPEGKMDDGFFEVIIIESLSLELISQVLFGRLNPDQHEKIRILRMKEVHLEFNRPVEFQIDGEFQASQKSIHARIVPQAIKILTP